VLGREWFEEDRQYGWVGPGGIFIHDLANDGKMVQCIGTTVAPWVSAGEGRRKEVDRSYLEGVYAGWKSSPVKAGMIEVSYTNYSSPTASYPQGDIERKRTLSVARHGTHHN
jgi:salicylate hydroxylase